MRPGLQPIMRAAVERLRREGKRFDLFDLGDIADLLDALDDCPYCERMLAAEARVETLEAALREIARREYIGETTDGLCIDSPVHGREEAHAIAAAVLRPPTPEGGAE